MILDNLFGKKFTETVFYKKDSELEYQISALKNVLNKYPKNEVLKKKLKLCELGLKGEKEIEYELRSANIGMYVLHDVNLEYKGEKAQIDYIIITPAKVYFVECKNLIGNITIDNKGNFIREYNWNNKKIREGIYSPIAQVERHREIFKKIWMEYNNNLLDRTIRLRDFDKWKETLVVLANSKSILKDHYAPKEIKKKVIKSDRLVEYLRQDILNTDKDLLSSQKEMHTAAYSIMDRYNKEINRDYEQELIEYINKNKKP